MEIEYVINVAIQIPKGKIDVVVVVAVAIVVV